MNFRVFPCDLEGSGCYRTIYPYGLIDRFTDHEVVMEAEMHDDRMLLPIPAGMVGYGNETAESDIEAELFMSSDVYVFQRPLEKIYPGVVMKLKVAGKKVVVELDDWMHGIASPTPKAGLKKAAKRSSVDALSLCVRMADIVTVSTEALAEQYRKINPNVVVIKNRIRQRDFEALPLAYARERKDGKIHVGWMGLMNYRAKDLSIIKPVLHKFLARHKNVVFVNVGSQLALDYLGVPKAQRIHHESVTFPGHFLPTSDIDIGLVPLTTNLFNECKSYLKGMEYGAIGAAVIASPTREYREWVTEGVNGYLAEETWEWLDCLEQAIYHDEWRQLGRANHEKAMDNLITAHYEDWLAPHRVLA